MRLTLRLIALGAFAVVGLVAGCTSESRTFSAAVGSGGGSGGATDASSTSAGGAFASSSATGGAGGSMSDGGAAGSSSSTATGGGAGGAPSTLCQPILNPAPAITPQFVNFPMPMNAMGGVIAPGTYYEKYEFYYQGGTVPSGQRRQALFLNPDMTFTSVDQTGTAAPTISGGTFSTAGTMLSVDVTCPTPSVQGWPYTATTSTSGTSVAVYAAAQEQVKIFVKQ